MKKLLFGLVATVMLSVSGNAQNLRANFLKGKTQEQIVVEFNKLSPDIQNILWVEKMDQLLNEDLPKEHKDIIIQMKDFFGNTNNPEEITKFVNLSVMMSKITPLEDLKLMFTSLDDYKFTGKFIGKTITSNEIIESIEDLGSPNNIELAARSKCSCRWCIGIANPGSNCEPTDRGCGWFWMQSCNHCVVCL